MVWISCWIIPMAIAVVVVRVIESLFGESISLAFKRKWFFYEQIFSKRFSELKLMKQNVIKRTMKRRLVEKKTIKKLNDLCEQKYKIRINDNLEVNHSFQCLILILICVCFYWALKWFNLLAYENSNKNQVLMLSISLIICIR